MTGRGRSNPLGAITPTGVGVAAIGAIAWFAAARWGWEELALMATVAALALLVGVAWTIGRPQLSVELDLDPSRVAVGGGAHANVAVTNIARRTMRPIRIELGVGDALASVGVGRLAPNATRTESVTLPTMHRSVIPVGPATSVRGDPLGLFRREVTWTGRFTFGVEELFVHATTVPIPSLTTGRLKDLEGETTNQRSPHDASFHSLREYVPGDDLRHVHWRTTARQADDVLMVREFVDTRRTSTALLVPVAADGYTSPEEFELALSIAASIGERCLRDQQELVFVAGTTPLPAVGPQRFADAISRIEFGSSAATPQGVVRFAQRVTGAVSIAVLISGSGSERAELLAAADQVGINVHTIAIRANLGAESSFHVARGTVIMEVGALDDLPRLVRTAG